MANVVKSSWFGRQVNVLLVSGKSVVGELAEVTDNYIVLNTKSGELQVMVHAIVAIRPESSEPQKAAI
jgi:ferredoxin-fold anticodon binding domain-containing protein